ncbi:hypothetical protein PM082_003674 [Marasmius tenuissimus]|nr:hypothetical protein PM082_003674 [Marasmius tenuissimus]
MLTLCDSSFIGSCLGRMSGQKQSNRSNTAFFVLDTRIMIAICSMFPFDIQDYVWLVRGADRGRGRLKYSKFNPWDRQRETTENRRDLKKLLMMEKTISSIVPDSDEF